MVVSIAKRAIHAGLRAYGLQLAKFQTPGDLAAIAAHEAALRAPDFFRRVEETAEIIDAMELTAVEERNAAVAKLLSQSNRLPSLTLHFRYEPHLARLKTSPIYWMALGAADYGRGDPSSALQMFHRAGELGEGSLAIHCQARCLMAMGDDGAAMALLDDVTDPLLVIERAALLFRSGDKSRADETARPALFTLDALKNSTRGLAEELSRAIESGAIERTFGGDLYNDDMTRELWHAYNASFHGFTKWQDDSPFIASSIYEAIEKHPADGPIIDFGAMCGYPDMELARKYPDRQVFAIDRQPLLKSLNDEYFRAPNLTFLDGDVLDFLSPTLKGATLFHARTATVCYPEMVKALYRKCAEVGVSQIIAIEFAGLSKETMKFCDFAEERSFALRSNMFVHPYRSMLREAGYGVVAETRAPKQPALFGDYGTGESLVTLVAAKDA